MSELEVSTTPAVVNQLINTKHVVELSVHLSAENMTTVVVFVSADDCATELVEAVEITESATVQFAFATGFDSALTVCSRFASEAAKATGTTLNLYSVFFDPSVWTPFFDIPFQVTGVSIKTPFDQDVLVNWIPLEESCENVNEGENLKGLKSTVFRKNGVLKACVSFYGNPYETIPTSQHLVSHVRPDRPDDDACARDREQPLHRAHRVGHAPPDRDDRVEARERRGVGAAEPVRRQRAVHAGAGGQMVAGGEVREPAAGGVREHGGAEPLRVVGDERGRAVLGEGPHDPRGGQQEEGLPEGDGRVPADGRRAGAEPRLRAGVRRDNSAVRGGRDGVRRDHARGGADGGAAGGELRVLPLRHGDVDEVHDAAARAERADGEIGVLGRVPDPDLEPVPPSGRHDGGAHGPGAVRPRGHSGGQLPVRAAHDGGLRGEPA